MKESQNNTIMHYDITVTGRVQHVGFRYSAENMARRYGISGIVRNVSDGTVYLEIEGSKVSTNLMLEWCRQGPGTARVKDVIVHEGELKGYGEFRVVD
ncbi:MAG: acylphosphatase [Bacteroidales bacterium]|nr:acylphosphatase [Bacteroidales bacterium]